LDRIGSDRIEGERRREKEREGERRREKEREGDSREDLHVFAQIHVLENVIRGVLALEIWDQDGQGRRKKRERGGECATHRTSRGS